MSSVTEQMARLFLPFLRQVPSKMLWTGVAHRTHSKGRRFRIFAHGSPFAESSHHHWTLASISWRELWVLSKSSTADRLVPAEVPASSGCGSLLSVRPVIVKSPRSSPCSARYWGNPPQRQNKTPMEAEYTPAIWILIFHTQEVPLYFCKHPALSLTVLSLCFFSILIMYYTCVNV